MILLNLSIVLIVITSFAECLYSFISTGSGTEIYSRIFTEGLPPFELVRHLCTFLSLYMSFENTLGYRTDVSVCLAGIPPYPRRKGWPSDSHQRYFLTYTSQ